MAGKEDIEPLSITDGKISNQANISFKKLAKATEGQILVAQSDGRFAAKSLTGDITLEASGATSVTSTTTTTDGETTVVTGPAGPTGAQGQVGAQGAQGPAGSDATVTTSAVDSAGAVMETDLIQTSAGAGDASKPIKLDSTGKIDASMIDDGDISYNNIADVPSTFAPSSHNHDDRYYTETETDTLLAAKAASTHNHDSTYLGIAAQAADSDMLDGQHGADFAAADHGHTASDVTDGSFDDARISQSSVTQHEASIDHDALTNFVANEHIDWTADQGTTNIHSGNYTDTTYTSSDFDHNALTNYDVAEHRVIDDTNTDSQEKLWSAYNITTQLGTKSDTSHTHSAATTSADGFMSSGDKTKLDAYPSTNATHNNEFLRKDGTFTSTPAGSGSGTVNSGTANEMAFYAADGTAVSGTSAFTFENSTDEEFNIGNGSTKGELGIACGVGSTNTTYRLFVNGHIKAGGLFDKSSTDYYLKPAGDSDYIAAKIGGSLFCYDVNSDVTAPTGYAGIYAKTVSSNVRLFASDGVSTTQISPHDDQGNWIHHNYNFAEKKRTIVNMTELVKAVEELAGRSFTTEELDEE